MADPDFIYDPEDWEATFAWADRHELSDHCEIPVGTSREFATLTKGPTMWCVNVITSWHEDEPDETELQWFDNAEDAAKAVSASAKAT